MPKALVIDDEPAITTIISRFLRDAGFETKAANSGPDGLEKAMASPPDIVIIDIMMPDVDGYEVCRRLRNDPRTARAVILALTARGQLIDKQMAFRAGADAHVTKPFRGNALVDEVQRLLDQRKCQGTPLGWQISVLRLKDNVGSTTLATNLALSLAGISGCQTALVDMVLQGGAISQHLALPDSKPWDLSTQMSPYELASYLIRYDSGLFVLPASSTPAGGQATPTAIDQLLGTLRDWHDFVLIDTPVNLGLSVAPLLRSSMLFLLMLTPEPTVLRQAQAGLKVLVQAGVRPSQVWPVLSMIKAEKLKLRSQVEKLWNAPVTTLPWSPEICGQALATKSPIILSQPESEIAEAINGLAGRILKITQTRSAEAAPA